MERLTGVNRTITFFVAGRPQPAGSKRGFARGKRVLIVDANPRAGDWKNDVRQAAQRYFTDRGISPSLGPVQLQLRFFRERPAAHYNTRGTVKDRYLSARPIAKPDTLKLARGVEDALTGIAYLDDSRVVDMELSKHYGDPGVEITIWMEGAV